MVASVPRWLPGAQRKGATTRGAGLTRPASIAAAAWRALRVSRSASSMRLRNSLRGSGSTKCTCERGAGYAWSLHAYITAKSVRQRGQISASEAPNSWLSSSRANNSRIGIGARPRGERLGKRWAKLYSTAATRAAQGKVAAHGRMGCVSGTKSATCSAGPAPPNQGWRERTRRLVRSPQDRETRVAGDDETFNSTSPDGGGE